MFGMVSIEGVLCAINETFHALEYRSREYKVDKSEPSCGAPILRFSQVSDWRWRMIETITETYARNRYLT